MIRHIVMWKQDSLAAHSFRSQGSGLPPGRIPTIRETHTNNIIPRIFPGTRKKTRFPAFSARSPIRACLPAEKTGRTPKGPNFPLAFFPDIGYTGLVIPIKKNFSCEVWV